MNYFGTKISEFNGLSVRHFGNDLRFRNLNKRVRRGRGGEMVSKGGRVLKWE